MGEINEQDLLSVENQIAYMRNIGVKFTKLSEDEAIEYLTKNNYFFKLLSYRKNYPKHRRGKHTGQYINLEFKYLRDLAIIDMKLRYLLLEMTLDIEHYAKLKLLRLIQQEESEGYTICEDFKKSMDLNERIRYERELERSQYTEYTKDLYNKYQGHYPIWVLVEVMTFGRFLSLYKFCADKYDDKIMKNEFYMLQDCKNIRNAAAHSSCILNDLTGDNAKYKLTNITQKKLNDISEFGKETINKKITNERIRQIVTLASIYDEIVTSDGMKNKTYQKIRIFEASVLKYSDSFQDNYVVYSTLDFIVKSLTNMVKTDKKVEKNV